MYNAYQNLKMSLSVIFPLAYILLVVWATYLVIRDHLVFVVAGTLLLLIVGSVLVGALFLLQWLDRKIDNWLFEREQAERKNEKVRSEAW